MRIAFLTAAVTAGVAATAWVGPALAQTVSEEIVVQAHTRGGEVRSISVPVSYRDLDLTTEVGRDTLKQRVKETAQEACRRLGEGGMGSTGVQPSCEQDAINSAADQQRLAIAQAKPRAASMAAAQPATTPSAEEAAAPTAATAPSSLTNGPVPDTKENRQQFGGPDSHAGRRTKPAGN